MLTRSFLIGLDFLLWTTKYRELKSGTENRVNFYLQYNY